MFELLYCSVVQRESVPCNGGLPLSERDDYSTVLLVAGVIELTWPVC